MHKPKVCFVTPFFYPVIGGVETHILEVGKELISKGWEVYVVTSDSDRKGKVAKSPSTYEGLKIVRCPTHLRVSFGEIFFPSAIKEINRINPDIVHIHGFRHWYNLIPLFIRKPCFMTPHWPDYRGQRPRIIQGIADFIDLTIGKRMMKFCRRICTVTDDEREWVKSFDVNSNNIILTPNALPRELLKQQNPSAFKRMFALKDEKVILSVSRLHKSKGLDMLIRAAKFLPECKFVILGRDGGAQEELKVLAKKLELKNVIFGGEVSDKIKNSAYAAADLYCSASHFEAFGITILEAMSQGTPCIVSKKGGMPWVVGDTGLTFEENNLEALVKNIEKLILDSKLRKSLGEKAKARAKQFTWKKTADVLNREYKKFI